MRQTVRRWTFQSTLPTRGSDHAVTTLCTLISNFNPRSPRGGATLSAQRYLGHANAFQSTLPTRGSDGLTLEAGALCMIFQSTLPTRGSDCTRPLSGRASQKFQSTLPTRGSDAKAEFRCHVCGRISIHAPHEGERRGITTNPNLETIFQSTLPTRGSDSHSFATKSSTAL